VSSRSPRQHLDGQYKVPLGSNELDNKIELNGEYTWLSSLNNLPTWSVRARCADEGVLNMRVAIFVTVVAILVGFAAPTRANDRPSDPFGNRTVELNNDAPLVEMWVSL
jgi:hypothetical protein